MTFENATSRCWLEVDLDSIRENYRLAQKMLGEAQAIPVLKANAYGMGAVEVCRFLKQEGARLFAVATADEALQILRNVEGVEVLCMGLVGPEAMAQLIEKDMSLTLYSPEQGQEIVRIARELNRPAKVHIKVDTGLHRLGFDPEEAAEAVAALCADGFIRAAALFTHLAIHTAAMDAIQIQKLCAVRDALAEKGISIPLTHAVDSIGMVRYPDFHLDGGRIGAWLYGVPTRGAKEPNRCVGRFCARVSQVRQLKAGELIGYDDDSPLSCDSIVATVSAGYIDGTPRCGTNWQVEIRGARAKVLGIACMDQLMIDVTGVPGVQAGDTVTFVGGGIDVEEYSRMGSFNHNEAWARIGRRVPRIYYEGGTPVRICTEL